MTKYIGGEGRITDYSLGYILALDEPNAFPPPSAEAPDAGAVAGTGTEGSDEEEVPRCC